MKNRKLFRNILFLSAVVAFGATLVNQEKTLNSYKSDISKLEADIVEAEERKISLEEEKNQVDTPEFIEQMAREKLDMYYPNEIIYMDIEK